MSFQSHYKLQVKTMESYARLKLRLSAYNYDRNYPAFELVVTLKAHLSRDWQGASNALFRFSLSYREVCFLASLLGGCLGIVGLIRLARRARRASWRHAGSLCVLVAFTWRHFGLIGPNSCFKTYRGRRGTHAAKHPPECHERVSRMRPVLKTARGV